MDNFGYDKSVDTEEVFQPSSTLYEDVIRDTNNSCAGRTVFLLPSTGPLLTSLLLSSRKWERRLRGVFSPQEMLTSILRGFS